MRNDDFSGEVALESRRHEGMPATRRPGTPDDLIRQFRRALGGDGPILGDQRHDGRTLRPALHHGRGLDRRGSPRTASRLSREREHEPSRADHLGRRPQGPIARGSAASITGPNWTSGPSSDGSCASGNAASSTQQSSSSNDRSRWSAMTRLFRPCDRGFTISRNFSSSSTPWPSVSSRSSPRISTTFACCSTP